MKVLANVFIVAAMVMLVLGFMNCSMSNNNMDSLLSSNEMNIEVSAEAECCGGDGYNASTPKCQAGSVSCPTEQRYCTKTTFWRTACDIEQSYTVKNQGKGKKTTKVVDCANYEKAFCAWDDDAEICKTIGEPTPIKCGEKDAKDTCE